MKVEVIGFGLLVPIFFVTAGVQFDLAALASSTADLVLVPPKWCPASLDVFTRRDA
jgi:Kef-type K+ transport system membrane component KefB